MSPTSSSRPLAGRNALSATPRTNSLPSLLRRLPARPSRRRLRTGFYSRKREPSRKLAPRSTDGRCARPPDPAPAPVPAGMVAAGMGRSRPRVAAVLAATALAAAGCGGERQDAGAPSGSFDLEVTRASFPAEQRISEAATHAARGRQPRRPRGARPGRDGRDRAGRGRRRARRLRAARRRHDARGRRPARLDRRRGPRRRRLRLHQHLGGRPAGKRAVAHGGVAADGGQGRAATRSPGGSRPRWRATSSSRATAPAGSSRSRSPTSRCPRG